MKIIGLTGGIGSGKSVISNLIKAHGYTVVDADAIAHEITEPGQPALLEFARVFGEDVILEDGTLDRKLVGARAFLSDENRDKLNAITHKAIGDIMNQRLQEASERGEEVAFIDVPLLIESNMQNMCDSVWVVYCDLETKIERIMARDGLTRDLILDRMSRQLSDEVRNSYADVLIDNSGTLEEVTKRVEELIANL